MLKNMRFHQEAINTMADGILLVCSILERTYGPSGRSVVVENASKSIVITRSSQVILENFTCLDRYQNEGVQLVKEGILNMCEQVGDGSKLTALLVKGMVEEGLKYLSAGVRPVHIRVGLRKALLEIEKEITNNTVILKDLKELIQGVKSACQDDMIARMVVDAYQKVSKEGVILVKPSKRVDSYMELEQGMQIKQGYISPGFCEKGKDSITYLNPYILVTDQSISSFSSLLPLLELIVKEARPLLIISEDVTSEALAMLLHNVSQSIFKVVAIKAEGYKTRKSDLLEDIAVLTGGTVIRESLDNVIDECGLLVLGQANEVVVGKMSTTIIGGKGEEWKISNQIKLIQRSIDDEKTNGYDKEKFRERIGRLKYGVVTMYAGGRTSQEIRENKQKMESGVKAARNILDGGMLPGGGSFLNYMVDKLERVALPQEEYYGMCLLKQACTLPLQTLLRNNGQDLSKLEVINSYALKSLSFGYHVEKNEVMDMVGSGVMDSSYAIKMALQQAVSVVVEWLDCAVLMVSIGPDREDLDLMKQGVPIMW